MKRKQTKTEFRYNAGSYTHHRGPVENTRFDERLKTVHPAQSVNITRYNAIQLRRKIRLASYVPAVRLVKHASRVVEVNQ